MNRTVQQITHHFTKRLPDNKKHYRPDELRSYNFPSFLVQRIIIELKRNLADSMTPPETDWANTDSDTVREAWNHFVEAIRGEMYLPDSYARAIIETAVADILEMMVQPRQNIPDVIFGADEEISFEELYSRVRSVVVYNHFAKLLPRYMQKKQLKTLTKQRCRQIIVSADQKMTNRYTPLNWTQMLNPLFILQQGEVDPNLLRLFFEDKNAGRLAKRFDRINERLNRAQVIEVLSAADLPYKDEEQQDISQSSGPISSDSPDGSRQQDSPNPEEPGSTSAQTSPGRDEEEKQVDEEPSYPAWYEEEEDANDLYEEGDNNDSYEDDSGLYEEEGDTEENTLNALFIEKNSPTPEKPETVNDYTMPGFDQQPKQELDYQHTSAEQEASTEAESPEAGDKIAEQDNISRQEPSQNEPRNGYSVGEGDGTFTYEEDNFDREERNTVQSEEPDEEMPMWKRFFTESDDEEIVEYPQTNFEQPRTESTFYEKNFPGRNDFSETEEKTNPPGQSIAKEEAGGEPAGPVESKAGSPAEKTTSRSEQQPRRNQGQNKQSAGVERPVRRNPFDPDGATRSSGPASKAKDDQNQHKAQPNKARFLNKPIFGGTDSQESSREETLKLKKRLEDQREEFVEQIFQGSERAYEQAVLEISTYNTWRDASRYIQKEIFKRNLVNIYSEQAVEFTDRLQDYFTEKQNRN